MKARQILRFIDEDSGARAEAHILQTDVKDVVWVGSGEIRMKAPGGQEFSEPLQFILDVSVSYTPEGEIYPIEALEKCQVEIDKVIEQRNKINKQAQFGVSPQDIQKFGGRIVGGNGGGR